MYLFQYYRFTFVFSMKDNLDIKNKKATQMFNAAFDGVTSYNAGFFSGESPTNVSVGEK